MEVFETMFEGDWAGRFGRWIAVPSAEAADDPGGPGEAVGWIWVPQALALGLEVLVEGGKGCDLVCLKGKPRWLLSTTIARLQELDGDDRRLGRDGDELEQAVGGGDLAVFELEPLRLEHAEELLDQPAPLVPFDDTPGVWRARRRMGGEEAPVQRLASGWRMRLAHLDEGHR